MRADPDAEGGRVTIAARLPAPSAQPRRGLTAMEANPSMYGGGGMAGRRGHGEGSIYQRESDGKWCCVVDLGYVNGKRKRKAIYGKTRKEVSEKLKKVLREQQQGVPVVTERLTIARFLDRWLADVAQPTVRPKTYRSYADTVRLHIAPALGRNQLDRLRPQDVAALLAAKLASGLSPRSVRNIRTILGLALNHAVRWGLIARNVVTLTEPPKVERHEIVPFTPEEARRFLTVARGNRLYALYAVALTLGLRQGEALGLRWQDIDLDRGLIYVRKQLQRVDGALTLVEPKTGRSRRTISLPAEVVDILGEHRRAQEAERAVADSRWRGDENDLAFASTVGTPLEPSNILKRYKAILARAGLPPSRFHDLRHSCASLLLAQGVHPKVVQEILGHSQIGMTLDTYSHLLPNAQREAARSMNDLLAADRGGTTRQETDVADSSGGDTVRDPAREPVAEPEDRDSGAE